LNNPWSGLKEAYQQGVSWILSWNIPGFWRRQPIGVSGGMIPQKMRAWEMLQREMQSPFKARVCGAGGWAVPDALEQCVESNHLKLWPAPPAAIVELTEMCRQVSPDMLGVPIHAPQETIPSFPWKPVAMLACCSLALWLGWNVVRKQERPPVWNSTVSEGEHQEIYQNLLAELKMTSFGSARTPSGMISLRNTARGWLKRNAPKLKETEQYQLIEAALNCVTEIQPGEHHMMQNLAARSSQLWRVQNWLRNGVVSWLPWPLSGLWQTTVPK